MNVTLTNVLECKALSLDSCAFSATVLVDGKKVVAARNDGHGGSNSYDVFDRDAFAALKAFARGYFDGYEPVDALISTLLDRREVEKKLRRVLKTNVVIVSPTDPPGEYTAYGIQSKTLAPDALRVTAEKKLLPKHPGGVILNGDEAAVAAFIERGWGLATAAEAWRRL
jgi:hypothetical protein